MQSRIDLSKMSMREIAQLADPWDISMFQPPSIPGNGLWLRSDNPLIVLNGSNINTWPDMRSPGQAGNGNDAVQAVASSQPAYNDSDPDFAGHPSIDSAADNMTLSYDSGAATSATIYCVCKPIDTAALIYLWDATGVDRTIFGARTSTAAWTSIFDGVAWRFTAATTTVVQQLVYTVQTNDMVIRRNGVQIGTYGTYALRHLKDGIILSTAPGSRLKAAEYAIWNRELNAAEIGALEAYGAARYNL